MVVNGFDPQDSTAALQAAFDSGTATVLIPYMGAPWIVRPLRLHGDQEVIFEPGVVLLARRGEFKGRGDSLLTAAGVSNLTLRGYGATLRMHKGDYQSPAYEKAEWRMGIAIRGCRKVLVEGLRVESTGGDGFYVDGGGKTGWSEEVTIRNCVADDNHRQGISVISAVNLLVENCTFSNTRGTAPEAGIDLEPDTPDQRLVRCVIRNCIFENNHGHSMLVYLRQLSRASGPVSIQFENCLARGGQAGMAVGAVKDDGPKGVIEFRNCTAERPGKEGARIYDKSADGALVRFTNCAWSHPWESVPVLIQLRRPELAKTFGGIEFVDCRAWDTLNRPAVLVTEDKSHVGVRDLHGRIRVRNPHGARAEFGPHRADVDLKIAE